MTQKKHGRGPDETGGLLDPATDKEDLILSEAISLLFNTSPETLEKQCNGQMNRQAWRASKSNYNRGRMTIDRQLKLLRIAGFEISQQIRFKAPGQ